VTPQQAEKDAEQRLHDLLHTIDRGLQAQAFLASELGKEVLARAERDVQANLEEMATLDVDTEPGRRKYRELKLQIGIAESSFSYLASIVQEGHDAEAEFHEGETVPQDPLPD
jgi:hypothetical protein